MAQLAIGMIETKGLVCAIEGADAALSLTLIQNHQPQPGDPQAVWSTSH